MKKRNNPHELLKDTVIIAQKHKKTYGYTQTELLYGLLSKWALKKRWSDPDSVVSRMLNGKKKISADLFRVYFDEENPRCGRLLRKNVNQCLEFVLKNPKQRRTLATDIVALVNVKVPELDRIDLIGDATLSSESEVLEAYSRLLWYALCYSACQYALAKEQR